MKIDELKGHERCVPGGGAGSISLGNRSDYHNAMKLHHERCGDQQIVRLIEQFEEECAESIHAICKMRRHGVDKSNLKAFFQEFAGVVICVNALADSVDEQAFKILSDEIAESLKKWHNQEKKEATDESRPNS